MRRRRGKKRGSNAWPRRKLNKKESKSRRKKKLKGSSERLKRLLNTQTHARSWSKSRLNC